MDRAPLEGVTLEFEVARTGEPVVLIHGAHIVGHSYGGSIALQPAMDASEFVHSLALLEPALVVGSSAQSYRDAIARNRQRYAATWREMSTSFWRPASGG